MTKKEVLQDIDKLCGEIDKWVTSAVKAKDFDDFANNVLLGENLLSSSYQELSMLRGYIEENVKEE